VCNKCDGLLVLLWAAALSGGSATPLPSQPLILNIGANVGEWAQHTLRALPSAGVHSFELHPGTFALLQAAHAGAPDEVRARWTVHSMGMGAAPGTASVYGEAGSEVSNLRGGGEHGLQLSGLTAEVTTVAAFSRSALAAAPIDLVHIDAEGNDGDVILGMDLGRAAQRYAMIAFEYGGTWHDSRSSGLALRAVLLHLHTHAYDCWLQGERSLHAVDALAGTAHGIGEAGWGSPNLLCVRRDSAYHAMVSDAARRTADAWRQPPPTAVE
jgi:FkbM family methyltransferase